MRFTGCLVDRVSGLGWGSGFSVYISGLGLRVFPPGLHRIGCDFALLVGPIWPPPTVSLSLVAARRLFVLRFRHDEGGASC